MDDLEFNLFLILLVAVLLFSAASYVSHGDTSQKLERIENRWDALKADPQDEIEALRARVKALEEKR